MLLGLKKLIVVPGLKKLISCPAPTIQHIFQCRLYFIKSFWCNISSCSYRLFYIGPITDMLTKKELGLCQLYVSKPLSTL